MIVGDCRVFAIESDITDAMESPSQLALGFFVIHVGGRIFGVRQHDASLLGCSFNHVEHRLQRRGTHVFDRLADVKAADVAVAYLDALYRDNPRTDYFGLSQHQFVNTLHSSGSIWAPDGDEAFDDGSHILQFDVGSRVRIIAFSNAESLDDLSDTVREEWMDADLFYAIVSGWKTLFTADRSARRKAKSRSRP
ncbi:Imm42 family immunity protein [Agrobacterium vitis]